MPMEFFKSKHFLWLLAVIWVLLIFFISCWKFDYNLFNGFDLAIYNQAMFNSLSGNLMNVSLHPHNYFGDHFEPILILLLPLYAIANHPLTLILIQTLVLAVTIWPIYIIASKYLSGYWPNLIAVSWLLNPIVYAASVFEFHAIIFTACLLIWSIYFYKQNNYLLWLAFITLTLLSREDAALSIIAFGFIAIIEKKHWRWYLPTFILAGTYYFFAMKMITFFSPEAHYKFLTYYQELGKNQVEILVNIFSHPWLVLTKLFRLNNIVLIAVLLMPTAFIALYRPKWLLLSVPAFLGFALMDTNNTSIILTTHYGTILLPGYFLATTESLSALLSKVKTKNIFYLPVIKIILVVAIIYATFIIGGGRLLFSDFFKEIKLEPLSRLLPIDKQQSIISALGPLTAYSSGTNVYALHYVLTGFKQLSNNEFFIPQTDWLVIDNKDMIYFSATTPKTYWWKKRWDFLDDNLLKRINQLHLANITPTTVYFSKTDNNISLVKAIAYQEKNLSAEKVLTPISQDKTYLLKINCPNGNNNKIIKITGKYADNSDFVYYLPLYWGLHRPADCQPKDSYEQLIAVPKNSHATTISLIEASIQASVNEVGVTSYTPEELSVLEEITLN